MAWIDKSTVDPSELLLWAWVLRRAIHDYVLYKGVGAHRLRWQESALFIFGKESLKGHQLDDELVLNQKPALTFEEICEIMGWDPDFVRRKTRELDRNQIKKIETTKLLEDLDNNPPTAPIRTLWRNGFPVPFLSHFRYSPVLRRQLVPRRLER